MKESILNTCPFLSKMTFIIKETAYSNKKTYSKLLWSGYYLLLKKTDYVILFDLL